MNRTKRLAVFAFILMVTVCCQTNKTVEKKYMSQGKIDFQLSESDELMLDSIQRKTFLFFQQESSPEYGFVKDRSQAGAPASIASTGFAIPIYAAGVEREWMSRQDAVERTLNVLHFFADSERCSDTLNTAYRGFYYHFLNFETGKREWKCELSTIDTGILMMGLIFARNYYNADTPEEQEIRLLVAELLRRLDWDFFYMPDTSVHPHTISMSWKPESGVQNWGWQGYDEALFLYILAAGTGMENAEISYQAWQSTFDWQTPYEGLSHVLFPPLFGHQFSHCFLDLRGLQDDYMSKKGIDYFENSRRATLTQQQYAIENPNNWMGYDSLTWGITASDGPGSEYNYNDYEFIGYAGRGTSGKGKTIAEDGTLAPYAVLSSLPFTPALSLATIKNMNKKYGDKIWGRYGYYDSFNLTAKWVDSDYVGIDQGPMFIMIENFRTGFVWEYVMQDPAIQNGLERLGFKASSNLSKSHSE